MEEDRLPDEALRSAMELAVDVAAAGTKRRPPLAFPAELRPLLRQKRLTSAQIGAVRRAVDADDEFRSHLASIASADLVDDVGRIWLQRPPNWEAQLDELLGADGDGGDDHVRNRREERRRAAAHEAVERERHDHATTRRRLARERERRAEVDERLAAVERERDELAVALTASQSEVSELRTALAAADAATAAARTATASARQRAGEAEVARDAVLAARAGEPLVAGGGAVDLTDVRRAHEAALAALATAEQAVRRIGPALAAAAAAAVPASPWPVPRPDSGPGRRRAERPRRSPVQIPGGLYADSAAVAEHLLRLAGIVVLVDGYNVAKLGWPALTLEEQRERTIATAEDVARRWGTDLTMVFDGADVPGASAPTRRLVRVVYSPAGVLADDVLRAEVDQLDHRRAVVVVTSDQAVVNDVRAAGANTIASDQFLGVARR